MRHARSLAGIARISPAVTNPPCTAAIWIARPSAANGPTASATRPSTTASPAPTTSRVRARRGLAEPGGAAGSKTAVRRRTALRTLDQHAREELDELAVERASGFLLQVAKRRAAVEARVGTGGPRSGRRTRLRRRRSGLRSVWPSPGEPIGIPGAVQPLVVVADDDRALLEELEGRENLGARRADGSASSPTPRR